MPDTREPAGSPVRLDRIVNTTSVLLIQCSRDLKYVFVNRACEEFLGRTLPEIVGRRIVDVLGPAAFEAIRPHVERVLRGEVAEYEKEIPYATGPRFVHVRYEPDVDEGGHVNGWFATITDITEHRRAEREAAQLREELAHLTRVSTLGELSASLAHELNQPLTAILGNVRTAQRILRGEAPDLEELRRIMEDLAADDARAADVIRRLRALFMKGRREHVLLDPNDLVGEVLRMLHNDLALRGVALRKELGPALPPIRGDRVQLQQVVMNLAINGLEAMRDQTGERALVIRSRTEDASVLIEVADTGLGIAEADRSRLFTPFFTTKPTGMGMGLTIARSIVEAHGGNLSLVSRPGSGAVFEVRIPKAP